VVKSEASYNAQVRREKFLLIYKKEEISPGPIRLKQAVHVMQCNTFSRRRGAIGLRAIPMSRWEKTGAWTKQIGKKQDVEGKVTRH